MSTLKLLLAAATASIGLTANASCPKIIAHRGYWTSEGSAQNSVRALVKADSIKAYGSEFDVWMTADGVLVVNHDPTINGVDIEHSTSESVTHEKLANGENLPTLDQYLQTAQKLDTRLILELKKHDSRSREQLAVAKIIEMVKAYGLENRTDYITFSKDAFEEFINRTPKGTKVYPLDGSYTPQQVAFLNGRGIDYNIGVLKSHPEWINQCHDAGLEVNVWTVDSPEDIQWCIDHNADYITTNQPERAAAMVAESQR